MFRSWKSQVTDRLGMFEEWGLDRMLHRHRTRMATMIKEGKPPEEATSSANPYEEEERGLAKDNSDENKESKESEDPTLDTNDNESEERKPSIQVALTKPCGKLYFLWIGENMEWIEMNMRRRSTREIGLFAEWREMIPKHPGMFVKWRDGRKEIKTMTKDTSIEDNKKKLRMEAIRERLEAMSTEEAITSMLQGDLHASCKVPRKTLRLFISSTFCDTKAERNFLMRDTYPKIRDICEQNDLSFMAVDLGWGQADDSVFDQGFSRMCIEEMQRSRDQSLEGVPCVLHILTNKYGTPGLPQYIEKYEYQYIISCVEDGDSRAMINSCYVLDRNATPPSYRLKGISPTEPFIVSPDKHERKVMSARWTSTETRLFRIMKDAVDQCYGFKKERRVKWEISPFGCQASEMLNSNSVSERSICVFRDIAQLNPFLVPDNDINQRILNHYVDMDPTRHGSDPKGKKRLSDLKRGFKSKKVKCKKYSINWSPFGINESTHLDYLNHLTASVLKQLKLRIKMAMGNEQTPDDLVLEVASHCRYALDRAERCFGREALLNQISNYIADDSDVPLIVYGEEGSGKTSLLAASVTEIWEMFGGRDDVQPVIITRFCSLQKHLNTTTFLRSICQQIRITCSTKRSYEIMLQVEKSLDLENLGGIFKNLLVKASEETPIFLFLDSIDDLMNGEIKDWLPSKLPPNVKLVVSVQEDCIETISDLMKSRNFLKMTPMNKVQAEDILLHRFTSIGRILQPEQMDHILMASLDGPEYCSSMFRSQLLFEMSSKWSSSENPIAFSNEPSIMLSKFLEKLELDHGKILVAHVLSLLHLARCGLSEPHLLDILSGDEEVLDSVLLVNPPPTKRFPHSVFSWLRHDLGDHLAESSVHGHSVLIISNRQMTAAVNKRYVGNEVHLKEKYHSLIANYFLGEVQDRYPGRCLAAQPLHTVNPRTGSVYLNRTKLFEQPRASILGKNPSYVQNSLCNLTFIAAKCAAGMLEDLLEDYSIAVSVLSASEDMEEFKSFMTTHGQDISQMPETILERALEMPTHSIVHQRAKSVSESGEDVTPWLAHRPPKTGMSRITSAGLGSHFDTMSDITSIMGGAQIQTAA